ncbi:hypothetical protein THRCLA_11343 [Thraustotheca clavata]|uniref:Transmembrane protein n=1 Tax=Thraustotheca clavata TaxID=74557 RepID=A0A1V9Y7Z4_9STRA|nr:hypothetical protein THRCLA_11343 [Thraustotheca clavata]
MDVVCASGDRVRLRDASAYLKAKKANEGASIAEQLKNASLEYSPKVAENAPAKKAYLEKRRQYLQRRQEEKMYNKMLGKLDGPKGDADMQREMKSVTQHLSIGANMIAAMATAFFVAYYISSSLTSDETVRLLIGLGATIGMMIVEMVLYIARATKQEEIARRQRKKAV